MTSYENLSSIQKTRACLHRDVRNIGTETCHFLGLEITKPAMEIIAELVYKKLSVYGADLEAFAKNTYVLYDGQALSEKYGLECRVRQGVLTSPTLFNLYVNRLNDHRHPLDGVCVNSISYADDMVLLSSSIGAFVTKAPENLHAKRSTINADDVKLLVRRCPSLKTHLNIVAPSPKEKRRKTASKAPETPAPKQKESRVSTSKQESEASSSKEKEPETATSKQKETEVANKKEGDKQDGKAEVDSFMDIDDMIDLTFD